MHRCGVGLLILRNGMGGLDAGAAAMTSTPYPCAQICIVLRILIFQNMLRNPCHPVKWRRKCFFLPLTISPRYLCHGKLTNRPKQAPRGEGYTLHTAPLHSKRRSGHPVTQFNPTFNPMAQVHPKKGERQFTSSPIAAHRRATAQIPCSEGIQGLYFLQHNGAY